MNEDVTQKRRPRSLMPNNQIRKNNNNNNNNINNNNNNNNEQKSPPKLTQYHPPPTIRRQKSTKIWMGRPYARGQCYPLNIDSCNNNNTDDDDESLIFGENGGENSSHSNTARCFAFCFIFLFLLLLLYIPVYHQVQVREGSGTGGFWTLHHGGFWSSKTIPRNPWRQAPIAGWARNSSRDLKLYVQPDNVTALIEQPSICLSSSPLLLVVIVCSAVSNFDARQAIRDTWGSYANSSDTELRLGFLLGATESEEVQSRIESESSSYGDVIQEGFLDSYNNLTLKSVMLLKWVRSHCKHARYVMKTDDDMYVNLHRLLIQLRTDVEHFRPPTPTNTLTLPDYSLEPRGLLLGALICGARPIANTRSKWYAPRYMYAERTYPNYLSGTGYVMSADVVLRLFNSALHTPLFHLEDVFITGMCARNAGLRPRDHPGFSYQKHKLDACAYRNVLITSHRLNSTDLRHVWKHMQSPDLHCPPSATNTTNTKSHVKHVRKNKSCT